MDNSKWRIIPFESKNAFQNMAIDESIFRLYNKYKINTLRLYSWIPSTVSIGLNQDLSAEVDLSTVKKLRFQVVRRISGGGTVLHDSGNELTYSIVTTKSLVDSKSIEDSYYKIVDLPFKPLSKLGVSIDYDQIHCPSVFIRGKKISGNAQARSGDVILQHGTILLDYDPEIMYSVLKARPGKSNSEMVASVYQKVTTLKQEINQKMTPGMLAKYLIDDFLTNHPKEFSIGDLNEEERILAESLEKDKYSTKEWSRGRNK